MIRSGLMIALLAAGAPTPAGLPADDPLRALVDAENAFARYTAEKGMRDGFLEHLAEDSILFRPHAVPGRQWLEDNPARPGLLHWYPTWGEVSAAGDLGWTTGPWDFRLGGPQDSPVRWGHFFSIWQRQPDTTWKVVIDIGISHPAPDSPPAPLEPAPTALRPVTPVDVDAVRTELEQQESAFARTLALEGTDRAYSAWLADDARLYRDGASPAVGKAAALERLPKPAASIHAVLTGARVSISGDLGFTYGTLEDRSKGAEVPADHGVYTRAWKRQADGRWKIVVDVGNAAPPADGRTLYRDAGWHMRRAAAAHQAKDWAAMLTHVREAVGLRPTQPMFLYNLAAAYALNGNKEEALRTLGRVAGMGLHYPIAGDEDFASIRGTPELLAVQERMEASRRPMGRGRPALTIPGKGLIQEGLAFDPGEGAFFVGSVTARSVVKVGKDGRVQPFSSPKDGLWGAFGMKVDARRGQLWVASSAVPEMEGYQPKDRGRAGIFQYDLKTGKLLRRYLVPQDGADHVIGDLEVGPAGEVYATDSASPAIYVVRPKKERLEMLLEKGPLVSPQGLVLSPGGRTLYVADYARGLYAVDLERKEVLEVIHPAQETLLGIDGLYLHDGGLVAIQNGVNPARVVRLELNERGSAVRKLSVLEANHSAFRGPTLGVIVEGTLYCIANGQWEATGREGKPASSEVLMESVILAIDL